ncbi:MAG: LysM peptidoglycan-binding domain-containing protein [Verrucomicrobiota bacterium]
MNRIATTLTTLVGFGLILPSVEAADPAIQQLNARLGEIEERLRSIENSMMQETGSYSYSEQATIDATNGTAPETKKTKSKTYVIRDGDTLGSIARKNGVERSELLRANRLSEGQPIYIGETLLIPGVEVEDESNVSTKVAEKSKPADATKKSVVVGETDRTNPESGTKFHTVKKGDTLTSIARIHGTDVKTLKETNGLKSDVISLGLKLKLPASGTVASADSGSSSQEARYEYDNPLLKTDETYGYYTVRKGDNLYALARDFFSSMGELQRLNRLGTSTLIYPGDELIVPTSKYNAYHNQGEMAQR